VGVVIVECVDYICFIGLIYMGWLVVCEVVSWLVGVSFELGGKNVFYVVEDVDFDCVVEGVVCVCFVSIG